MLKNLFKTAAISSMLASALVFAQEPRITEHQDWVSVCADIQGQERCEIQQTLNMDNEQGNARLLRATVNIMENQLVMQLLLPLGIDLRAGIVMQIDDGEEFGAGFLTCVQDGCLVAFPLDATRLAEMRAGNVTKIGFRPFNTNETLVLEMSLMGFTRASQTVK
ncbi:MAG: invasion associated locus B family protein [Oceanospirillales bacterium]|nr:MAG: invasion associated locus B family protein [Oceanospirillales bacterium]